MKLRELRHNLWNIGFIEGEPGDVLRVGKPRIHWVRKRILDRWFADPFILDVTETEIIVLAEEYCYALRRGRIARVVIDRATWEEKGFEIILDLPTHLSFPFIMRKGGKVYLMPENSASGCSTVYEYDDAARKVTPLRRVAELPFTDATVFEMEGKAYLCSTVSPDANSRSVQIYSFDKETLQVTGKVGEAHFPIVCGRNAGEVFEADGQLYRPAQDCTACYGHGVILQRMEKAGEEWKFEPVSSLYPPPYAWKYNQGVHTFNHYKGLVVVDARGYRYPVIGRVLTFFYPVLKAVKKVMRSCRAAR